MLSEVIHHPEANRYRSRFQPGHFVFKEGDDSRDLFILISGELEVLKGSRAISRITEPGALFGEMSFLIGGHRTASVKSLSTTETLRVPVEDIPTFMSQFPDVGVEMARLLAKRLDNTTRVSYGLSEFCDRLPDAVLLTDENGRLLAWNRAAESLYSSVDHSSAGRPVETLYEDPRAYRQFVEGASSLTPVREKVLEVKRPDGQTGFVSTSLTLLYDGHHNFQGVLSLGRDVTDVCQLEKKYRFVRRWLVPGLVMLALMLAALFYGYPYYQRGHHGTREDAGEFHTLMVKDFLLLKSLVAGRLDRAAPPMAELLEEFMALQSDARPPYTGLLLLDDTKQVLDAVSLETRETRGTLIGSSYGGIDFRGPPDSIHRVLVLYRTDSNHPMGTRGIELAFRITSPNGTGGWLVFQMNSNILRENYGVGEEQLAEMVFKLSDKIEK